MWVGSKGRQTTRKRLLMMWSYCSGPRQQASALVCPCSCSVAVVDVVRYHVIN